MTRTQKIPDAPVERLALLVADLTAYAEKGGMSAGSAAETYDAIMEGLAGLDEETQCELLDRVHQLWSKAPEPRKKTAKKRKATKA